MDIYLKKDYMQYTGSFKERGARYTLMMMEPEQKLAGVIAASAGNHALALAYHGGQLSKNNNLSPLSISDKQSHYIECPQNVLREVYPV